MFFLIKITVDFLAFILYNSSCVWFSRFAELMELADMQDLGSCAARRVGSSPTFRIKMNKEREGEPDLGSPSLYI